MQTPQVTPIRKLILHEAKELYIVLTTKPIAQDNGMCGFDKRFGCEMDEKWHFKWFFVLLFTTMQSQLAYSML